MARTFAVAAIALVCVASAQAADCSKADESAALDVVVALRDWSAVHSAYQRFAHCDDGAIAEGFSESIVHILASNWNSITELNAMAARDSDFRLFVIRHIDETTDPEERRLMSSQAKCPANATAMCAAVRAAAKGK